MALTDIGPSNSFADSVNSAAASNYNPVNQVLSGRSALDTLANNWLVKPASAQGICGFVFDYEGETEISADNDITDHYTESNRFFVDHCARRPLEIVMRGFVAEVVQTAPQGVTGALSILQNKLTTLPALLGKYTPGALAKVQSIVTASQNIVNQIDNVINRAQGLLGLFASASPAPTKQEQAFAKLMMLRDTVQVFNLVTPLGLMAARDEFTGSPGPRTFVIKHLTFVQSEDSKYQTDISVTLKEVHFADVQGTTKGASPAVALLNKGGTLAYNAQGPTNKGQTTGVSVPFSTMTEAFA